MQHISAGGLSQSSVHRKNRAGSWRKGNPVIFAVTGIVGVILASYSSGRLFVAKHCFPAVTRGFFSAAATSISVIWPAGCSR
ncbi:hypothetical protein HA49_06370 [Tatumella morbirosei]|uniref:Uncharacterized protein n=1 Tax=Tatumella morbirosei TaxID=642227 RepID=A0A095TDW2_9GAMM|nr:hypothetical protein HA49_06370 [Tatumella morbirosei]